MGEKERAREFIIRNETELGAVYPSHVSLFFCYLGDIDKGMVWAEKAVEARDFYMLFGNVNPLVKPFNSDPRRQALIKRLGLVD